MKKLLLAISCATGVSVSYAAGLFDMIGSTLNTITGNNSTTSQSADNSKSNSNASVSKKVITKKGWTIVDYTLSRPNHSCKSE